MKIALRALCGIGGQVREGIGRLTEDARLCAEGLANQAAGTAQDLYGQAGDTAREQAAETWIGGCDTPSRPNRTPAL